jgi:preprotein translocase subunit Sss1
MNKGTLIGLIIAIGFIGFVVYTSMANVAISCEVCIEYNGGSDCRTAAAPTAAEAISAAQNTACGIVGRGSMNDAIACGRVTPTSTMCTQ